MVGWLVVWDRPSFLPSGLRMLLIGTPCHIQCQLLHGRNILPQLNLGHGQQDSTGSTILGIMIGITHIHDLPNANLDDHLGTFMTWKQRHVNRRPLNIGTPTIQNGIDFGMTDVEIFVPQWVGVGSCPGKAIIGTTPRKAVVSQSNNPFGRIDDAGTYLRIWILRSLCR